MDAAVRQYITEHEPEYIEQLKALLRIPSVSTDPARAADVVRCAEWLAEEIERIGFPTVEILPTGGHPVVYGEHLAAGPDAPTVLVYGHYDVQPVDPIELWSSPPFEPEVRDGKLYARGATDDKGQLFLHLKGLEALLAVHGSLPVNVKLLIEGEEEIGSVHLTEFLTKHRDRLAADLVLISDTAMYAPELPTICYGLRGLAYLEVHVTGPKGDLHSGTFGGGLKNPIEALANIITGLKDADGRILIDGFYDKVRDLTDDERAAYRKLPFDRDTYLRELDVATDFGESGYTIPERLSGRPTLECNGILGGFTGEGAKTVLPSKAMAKISMRLVPDQDPAEIDRLFAAQVAKLAPAGVKVEVRPLHGGKPSIVPTDNPGIRAAQVALMEAYGKPAIFTREGGSIPVVNTFLDLLGIPSVLMGFGLHDENLHAPNEHFNLSNYRRGILASAAFFEALAAANVPA